MEDFLKSVVGLIVSVMEFIILFVIRPIWKVLAHFITGQCELERIVDNHSLTNFDKNELLEYSLKNSRYMELSNISKYGPGDADYLTELVVKIKRIGNKKNSAEFRRKLVFHLMQIFGYDSLKRSIEIERTNFYDNNNEEHEKSLLGLWSLLKPGCPLRNRVSDQWPDVGFQGDDPATDFRGMGMLGLNQLRYFASLYNAEAVAVMNKSCHPTKGYPFAIVGISMTSLIRDLLKADHLKRPFYAHFHQRPPKLEDFHELYCKVFIKFDKFWYSSNPESIMEYVPLRTKFYENLIVDLNSAPDRLYTAS